MSSDMAIDRWHAKDARPGSEHKSLWERWERQNPGELGNVFDHSLLYGAMCHVGLAGRLGDTGDGLPEPHAE